MLGLCSMTWWEFPSRHSSVTAQTGSWRGARQGTVCTSVLHPFTFFFCLWLEEMERNIPLEFESSSNFIFLKL